MVLDVRPSVRSGYDDKYRSGNYRFVERQKNCGILTTNNLVWTEDIAKENTAITAHRPLSSVMRSNNDIDRPVNSLMLSFHDLRGLFLRRLLATVAVVL